MRYERPFCHGLWPSNFRLGLAPNESMSLITSGRIKRSESGCRNQGDVEKRALSLRSSDQVNPLKLCSEIFYQASLNGDGQHRLPSQVRTDVIEEAFQFRFWYILVLVHSSSICYDESRDGSSKPHLKRRFQTELKAESLENCKIGVESFVVLFLVSDLRVVVE